MKIFHPFHNHLKFTKDGFKFQLQDYNVVYCVILCYFTLMEFDGSSIDFEETGFWYLIKIGDSGIEKTHYEKPNHN